MSSFAESVARLSSAQKPPGGISPYSRYVNRPAGRRLAAAAFVMHRTPNQVSVSSAVVTAAGLLVLVLVRPSVPAAVLVWLLMALGFALDAADGQLARLRGGGSPNGEWLDHVLDSGKMVGIHGCVAVFLYRSYGERGWALVVPLVYGFVAVVMFSGGALADLLRRAGEPGFARPSGSGSRIRSLALLPADYGVMCLVFLTSFSRNALLPLYTAFAAMNAVILVMLLHRWYAGLVSFEARPRLVGTGGKAQLTPDGGSV